MEAPDVLAARLMSQYEDRLPLRQICDEILLVLREGGLRIGDPVPRDLATEAEQRLAFASTVPAARSGSDPGRGRSPAPGEAAPLLTVG
jgi:hypothetical protein